MSLTSPRARPRLSNFLRHAWWEQLAFVPVWLLLGVARLVIVTISFERVARALGSAMGTHAVVPLLSPRQQVRARRVATVVPWVAAHTPWTSNCFPQALVARLLLGASAVPWVLCFGVRRDADGALAAHAWVAAGPVNVTGGASFGRLTVVACFTSLSQTHPARAA
jgi:hypothetical protein